MQSLPNYSHKLLDDASGSATLNFVTVVYASELDLLQLQARSFDACMAEESLDRIHVIINDPDAETVTSQFHQKVLEHYGKFKDKVIVWQGDDLIAPHKADAWRTHPRFGWYRQQVLKLTIANKIPSDMYITLDAKNHFFRDVASHNFVSAEGLPKTWRMTTKGPLRDYFINSLNAFDLDIENTGEPIMPSITPYVLWTKIVRDMIQDIQKRHETDFTSFFLEKDKNVSEFHLYYAYFVSQGLKPETIYAFSDSPLVALFRIYANAESEEISVLKQTHNPSKFILGIHSSRIFDLHDAGREHLISTWVRAGIFKNSEQAESFMSL
ncbi:MAG: DUF6492 family protein [Pseudomonadota bacterium]